MGKKEELDSFYTLISGFLATPTAYSVARKVIDEMYQGEKLKDILDEAHSGSSIFGVLAQHAELKLLLYYFCQVNPTISTRPFNIFTTNGLTTITTLLELFQSNEKEYTEILTWLNRSQLTLATSQEQKPLTIDLIAGFQNDLILYINENENLKFLQLLQNCSRRQIHAIIHQSHDEFLTEMIDAPSDYISLLIDLDLSILEAELHGRRFLDKLCDFPKYNQVVLESILQKHGVKLTEKDRKLIDLSLAKSSNEPDIGPGIKGDEALKPKPNIGLQSMGLFGACSLAQMPNEHRAKTRKVEIKAERSLLIYVLKKAACQYPFLPLDTQEHNIEGSNVGASTK